ncbi:MAG: response regulator [Proteobacteria bacterium]|nr:response regulator [Pseudomonadota bacterium]NOG60792.1 response regulator [Pseudomonadota bacterium]
MSDSTLEKILIIDDNSDYRKLICTFLSKLLPSVEVLEYDPVFEGVPDDDFDWSEIDVLLLDYHLSIVGTTGLDILHKHHKKSSFPATIMLTGAGTEEIAIRALKSGIYEYQPKQTLTKDKLKQSIIHAWEDKKSERKKKQEITQHNRSFSKEVFYENLERAFDSTGPERALVIIRPDNIEILEEEIGIIGRDNLVNHIAKNSFEVFKLGACNPNITRISDAEIGVQIDYPINKETLEFNMQGLCKHLSKCIFKFSEEKYNFSVSIGVLKLGIFNKSAEQLIYIASNACDHASNNEGNAYYIWKDTDVAPEFIDQDENLVSAINISEKTDATIRSDEKEKLEAELIAKEEEAKEQARLRAEQEAKEKADAEAEMKAAKEEREKLEAQLKAREEEAKEQARLRAEQEAKEKADAETKIKAAKEEKEKLEAQLKAREEEAKEQARLHAEQEAKEKADAETKIKAAKEKADAEAEIKAAKEEKEKLEAQLKAREEEAKEQARLRAEQEAKEKANAEAKIRAAKEEKEKLETQLIAREEEAKEQARLHTEQEAREKADAEAKIKAAKEEKEKLEAQLKAREEEAKEQARLRTEQEEKEKADAEAIIKTIREEKEKLEAQLKAREEEAKEQAQLRAEQEEKEKADTEATIKAAREDKEKLEAELKAIAKAKADAEAEMKAAKEEKEKLEAELKAIAKAKADSETEPEVKTTNSTPELKNKLEEESSGSNIDDQHENNENESKETGPSIEEIEVQVKKLIDEKKIIQTYQPVTAMFGDEDQAKEIYKTGLQAISDSNDINEYLSNTSIFSIPLQQTINEWVLRQIFLRITESGTTNCQYSFLITVTESWFSDITLFQWLQKILSQTKKYNPGKSIILDVPLDIFDKHQKRADALINTLRKSHQFTISLSNIGAVDNILERCSVTSSSLLIVDIEQLKKLSETLAPQIELETNNEEGEEPERQNLLQYLKSKKIRIVTSGIEDSTLLTDAITAGTDYTLGNFVGEVQDNLVESGTVESFELT